VSFVLHLESAARYERVDAVEQFIGEDASGQFGLLSGHERFVTRLVPGLARFRIAAQPWEYLALADAVVRFDRNELHISALRHARDADYRRIQATLRSELSAQEAALAELHAAVRRLDEEMWRRIYALERGHGA